MLCLRERMCLLARDDGDDEGGRGDASVARPPPPQAAQSKRHHHHEDYILDVRRACLSLVQASVYDLDEAKQEVVMNSYPNGLSCSSPLCPSLPLAPTHHPTSHKCWRDDRSVLCHLFPQLIPPLFPLSYPYKRTGKAGSSILAPWSVAACISLRTPTPNNTTTTTLHSNHGGRRRRPIPGRAPGPGQ